MARLPKDASEAVALLGVKEGSSVIAIAPSKGFTEALASSVGDKGSVIVRDPPPETEAPEPNLTLVDELPADATADVVLVWSTTVPPHELRDFGKRVTDGGVLWAVLPRTERDVRAPVTEGDVSRAMLAAGWREDRNVALSTEAYALRFHRRR